VVGELAKRGQSGVNRRDKCNRKGISGWEGPRGPPQVRFWCKTGCGIKKAHQAGGVDPAGSVNPTRKQSQRVGEDGLTGPVHEEKGRFPRLMAASRDGWGPTGLSAYNRGGGGTEIFFSFFLFFFAENTAYRTDSPYTSSVQR